MKTALTVYCYDDPSYIAKITQEIQDQIQDMLQIRMSEIREQVGTYAELYFNARKALMSAFTDAVFGVVNEWSRQFDLEDQLLMKLDST